jgi:hypothetical protein
VNEEKNAARDRAIQIKPREAKNAYKLAQTRERERCLFRKKARQLDEEALIKSAIGVFRTLINITRA